MEDWFHYLGYNIVKVTKEEYYIYDDEDNLINFAESQEDAEQKCKEMSNIKY